MDFHSLLTATAKIKSKLDISTISETNFCFVLFGIFALELKFMCPMHNEAKQIKTVDFGAVKDLSLGSSKGKRQLMLKRPKFPYGFQQFLKAAYSVRAAECMTLLIGWW